MIIRSTPNSLDRSAAGGAAHGAVSLTDLFATDALLDLVGTRSAASRAAGRAEAPSDEPVLRLLRALADSVDTDLDQGEPDPVVIAALAAGFELAASSADEEETDLLERSERRRSSRHGDTLHVVGGRAGRRLHRRRPYRAVAVVAGVALALCGGGFAAAATTDPAHAWGPLKPVVRALHPGWQADLFAAKRDAILRTLDRASQQSLAGQPVAAAVTYGTARQQARELPKGPDAVLQARLNAVAQQLGLAPETADPADPSVILLPGLASVAPGAGTGTYGAPNAPTGGAAPGTLPPIQPDPAATGDGSATGTTGATDGTGTTTGDTGTTTGTTDTTTGSTVDPTGATGASTAGSGQTDSTADAGASASPSPEPSPAPTDTSPGAGPGVGAAPASGTDSVSDGSAGSTASSSAGSNGNANAGSNGNANAGSNANANANPRAGSGSAGAANGTGGSASPSSSATASDTSIADTTTAADVTSPTS